jgi:hypothetical protein
MLNVVILSFIRLNVVVPNSEIVSTVPMSLLFIVQLCLISPEAILLNVIQVNVMASFHQSKS